MIVGVTYSDMWCVYFCRLCLCLFLEMDSCGVLWQLWGAWWFLSSCLWNFDLFCFYLFGTS